MARLVAGRQSLTLVGGVDVDPDKARRDLGEVIGLRSPLEVQVADDIKPLLANRQVSIVTNCTGSSIAAIRTQLEDIITAGVDVISTCEELACPTAEASTDAGAIDALARAYQVPVSGTGINPGFMMDTLPILMKTACQDVNRVEVLRVANASERREPLQRKIGAGKPVNEFEALAASRRVRHIGMLESVTAIARALNWPLDHMTESIEPVIADQDVETPYLHVAAGQVAGVRQIARGFLGREEVINLELRMYVGAPGSLDRVRIKGVPDVENQVQGVHGDLSTAAVVVNCIPQVLTAPPGLITMAELTLPHWFC